MKLYNDNKQVVDEQLMSQLKEYLTTDKGYVLREFKGKSVIELGIEADRIRRKWRLIPDENPLLITTFEDVLGSLGELYNEVNGPFLGFKSDINLITDSLQTLSIFSEFSEFGRDEDVSYYIRPSVCVKKALWPF